MKLRAGPLKKLHLDRAKQRAGEDDAIVIECNGNTHHARHVRWSGHSVFIYKQDYFAPVYAWIETTGEVIAE